MVETIRHDKTARQLRLLSDALDSGRLGPVRRLVNTLSPAEIGNLLELRRAIRGCDLSSLRARAPALLRAKDRKAIEEWLQG